VKHNGLFSVYTIKEMRLENAHACTLLFNDTLPDTQPGQYVMAWLPGVGEKPFSVSGDDPLALTVADVGPVSHALNQLCTGDRVWVRGPLGKGFSLTSQNLLVVGGGYGAAPLSLLASRARQQSLEVTAVLGARTRNDLIMTSAFEASGCHVYLATEDGSTGIKGMVTAGMEGAYEDFHPDGLYACGPTGMLLAAAEFAREKNIPAQLSFEAVIRCGIGLCGSCELPEETCLKLGIPAGFLVCHDGPVVYLNQPFKLPKMQPI